MSLLYEKESYAIIGACFEVYKQKGCGSVEQDYQECLKIEFDISNVPYRAQSPTPQLPEINWLASWFTDQLRSSPQT